MYDFSNCYLKDEKPIIGKEPFEFFKPDYTDVQDLYRVEDEPINIVNNAENVPFIQNVAQSQLVEVSESFIDTSTLSDKQIKDGIIPRFAEISDIEDLANLDLKELSKSSQVNGNT